MDIKKIVEDLRTLADDLEKMDGETQVVKEEPKEEIKTEDAKEPEKKSNEPTHSLEEVRAVLAEKSQAGLTAQVRETISKFGANKLSEVSSDVYDELYEAAMLIGGES